MSEVEHDDPSASGMSARQRAMWLSLTGRCRVSKSPARALCDQLGRAYAEPGRYYHTIRHIDDVLCTLYSLAELPSPAQELAVWFHDAVYDPRRTDNEERSAVWAVEALTRLGLSMPLVERVGDLILLTKSHDAPPHDVEAHQFLDADLAVLGAAPDTYKTYADGIRREYAWIAEADYRRGRRAVLQRFLARPRIYATDSMYRLREAKARANLAAEIAALSEE